MKASAMLEKKRECGTILAFDVRVTPEARELADELGVKIFFAHVIDHLLDQFKAYMGNLKRRKRRTKLLKKQFFHVFSKSCLIMCLMRRIPLSWALISLKVGKGKFFWTVLNENVSCHHRLLPSQWDLVHGFLCPLCRD